MKKSLPQKSLVAMNFAVLGLGDSSYQKYVFIVVQLVWNISFEEKNHRFVFVGNL